MAVDVLNDHKTNIDGTKAYNRTSPVEYLLRDRTLALRVCWLILSLAIASGLTYLRLAGGLGSAGVPLVFYLPAIIATTLVAGAEIGIAALALSLLLVWVLFTPPALTWHLPSRDQSVTLGLWAVVAGIIVWLSGFLRSSLQELSRNELRYRKLAEVTSDIVWITDEKGHSHAANTAFTRVTGLSWPDTGGHKWLKAIHEEDRAAIVPNAKRAEDYHQVEFRLWDATAKEWRWYRSRAVAIKTPQGEIVEWITAMRDVHQPKLARERTAIIVGESRHRLKNLVTIIESIAKGSQRKSDKTNPETVAFVERFVGRLRALGTAADLALAGQHQIMDLRDVVKATLEPFMEESEQIHMSGSSLVISQETGGSVALAIHELATNAIKYGALSVPGGFVSLSWIDAPEGDNQKVTLLWKERGGPPVTAPSREGYGSRVIRAAASRERDGRVAIDYQPDGLQCELSFAQTSQNREAAPASQ